MAGRRASGVYEKSIAVDGFAGPVLSSRHTLRYREVEDEIKGVTFKHQIAETNALSMKRLSKVEAADDPPDGADEE